MNEDRPIIFTVSQDYYGNKYLMRTKDPRGIGMNRQNLSSNDIFRVMLHITETLNNLGYAVLFEVD